MLRILDPEDQDDCDSSDDCGLSETCIASGESGRQECVEGMAMHYKKIMVHNYVKYILC